MNWAGWTLVIFGLLNLGIHLGKHGEAYEQKYNFWIALISVVINFGLYYFAGILN